ncbi:MAG: hypothetical protein ACO27O_00135 [Hylemonella sp.]
MRRALKWLLIALLVLFLLMVCAVWLLQRWVASDDFRLRVQQQASLAVGLPVQLGALDVSLWPLPSLVLAQLQVQTNPPLTVERIEVRPIWADLLQGKLAPDTLVVRRAVISQMGLDTLRSAWAKRKAAGPDKAHDASRDLPPPFLPRHLVLDSLTWRDEAGTLLIVRADLALSPDSWPSQMHAQIVQGRLQGAKLDLRREGQAHAWGIDLQLAGGTGQGRLELSPPSADGAIGLKGELRLRDVEVSRLTAAEPTREAQAQQPLSGLLESSTRWSTQAAAPSGLAAALQTSSSFTVRQAVVTGEVNSRGKALQIKHLVARSGVLGAEGHVAIAPDQSLDGALNVALADAVAVPLSLGGTVQAPKVTLAREALTRQLEQAVPSRGELEEKARQGLQRWLGR